MQVTTMFPPDGKTLAFVANGSDDSIYPDEDIFLLEVGSDQATNITEDNPASDDLPMFSPDGRSLAFSRQHIAGFYADQVKLMIHDLASGKSHMEHGDWDRSAAGLAWAPDSQGLYGAIDDEGTRRVYYLPLSGDAPAAITGQTDFGPTERRSRWHRCRAEPERRSPRSDCADRDRPGLGKAPGYIQ